MSCIKGIAVLFTLIISSTAVIAAAKYAAPAIPVGDVGVVKFDAGSPVATWHQGATALKVQSDGKYNYDDAWEFKKLEIELQQINGANVTVVT